MLEPYVGNYTSLVSDTNEIPIIKMDHTVNLPSFHRRLGCRCKDSVRKTAERKGHPHQTLGQLGVVCGFQESQGPMIGFYDNCYQE